MLLCTCLIGLYRYQRVEPALRILVWLYCISFIAECLAFVFARQQHNNMAVYGIYSWIELAMVCAYFNSSIAIFRAGHIGYWIGAGGVALGIANTLFLQPLNKFNNYFLYFEGILTIAIALFSFARIMIEEAQKTLTHNPHFWIGIAFIFFWSVTFCNWALYQYLYIRHPSAGWIVDASFDMVNIITYGIVCVVFVKYPKWVPVHE